MLSPSPSSLGIFGNVRRHFGLSQLIGVGWGSCSWHLMRGGSGMSHFSTFSQAQAAPASSSPPLREEYLAQNVSSAEAEKP